MKALKRILALCLIAGSLIVFAGFVEGENNGAWIEKDFGCNVIDGFGDSFLTTEGTISIVNHGMVTTLICKAKGVPTPGYEVIWEGFPCGTFMGSTTNSYNVVSEDGNVTLRCQIKRVKK